MIPDRLPSLIVLVGFWIPPAVAGWVAAGSPSAKHQALPRHSDLRGPGDLRAGLRCGVVPLQPRPHAAVHTRSIDRSNVRAAEGRRGSRRCSECARVARQRARLRVGVSQPWADAQAHVDLSVRQLTKLAAAGAVPSFSRNLIPSACELNARHS